MSGDQGGTERRTRGNNIEGSEGIDVRGGREEKKTKHSLNRFEASIDEQRGWRTVYTRGVPTNQVQVDVAGSEHASSLRQVYRERVRKWLLSY